MNRILTTAVLTLTLTFALTGCGGKGNSNHRKTDNAPAVIAANKDNAPAISHECGAKTKADKACTRQVAAGNERCWQHRGQQ